MIVKIYNKIKIKNGSIPGWLRTVIIKYSAPLAIGKGFRDDTIVVR